MDLSIRVLKSSTASYTTCEQQQRKAVRLNGAILMELKDKGVDVEQNFLVIAEGRGLAVNFYTLRRYGDVLGAGRAISSSIWFPAHVSQFKRFLLSDTMHILLAFAEHTRRYGMEVADTIAARPAAPLPKTPPRRPAELKQYILLTPSKQNKRSRIADNADDCD
ncbi:hypothetical protein BGZ99_004707 [Dissophora globulifera]|uniref:Uncharacterized protein n=1 Tax=Dissophora globulifera TaxID=979702 RepID=A0A9P6RKX2_9FUNG|nr:hypothetical protein BGZ99_004707 [Dissophora globulifera]